MPAMVLCAVNARSLVLCFAACITAAFGTSTAQAAVWYVDRDNVSGTENGTSWTTAYVTVQPAIDAAFGAGGGEVWVAEGVYGEARTSPNADGSGLDTGSIVMKEGVHLYGGFAGTETLRADRDWTTHVTTLEGSTARSGSAAYHVVVGANNATLDGFSVTGGNANGAGASNYANYGAGMYNISSSPTVNNCTFSANNGTSGGGGMYNRSSSPTVSNCTFSLNTATSNGGGMYNISFSSPSLTSTFFSENTANTGGGMYNTSSSSPTLTNCTFSANSASYGGGMDNYSSASPTVDNCAFLANAASNVGGGMSNRSSSSPTVNNCTFTTNTATSNGGGMCNTSSSSPTVTNSFFSENTANTGGGMYNSSSSPAVTNCTFTANSAVSCGGMRNISSSSPTLTNCILWGNDTDWYSDGTGAPVVTYSNIGTGYSGGGTGNISIDPLFMPRLSDARLRIGSPCINTGTATGAPATDLLGVARPQGAGVDMGAYEVVPVDSDGDTVPDSYEDAGDLDGDGLANYLDADSDNDGIPDGVDLPNYYVNRTNTFGPENGTSWATAYNTIQEGIDAAFNDNGGQVWVAAGVYDEARTSPNADGSGLDTGSIVMKQGVHLYGGFAGTETLFADRDWNAHVTTIDGASARSVSPAYHVVVGANNATLDGFSVTGGNANGAGTSNFANYGAGMYNKSSSPMVSNCTFTANTAKNGTTSGGGGMYNVSSSPTVTNCSFIANAVTGNGGGMYNNASSPTVTNCTFMGNSVSWAGGGGMYNNASSPTVTNCTFSVNSANLYGGGMDNDGSSPTVTNCIFSTNAAAYGGGMLNNSSSPTVTNCIFTANSASNTGGGMRNETVFNPVSSPVLANCTFSANTAAYGGGMYNYKSLPVLTNCTFGRNSARYSPGGMGNDSSSPTLTNCILWGNGQDWDNSGGTPIVTYSNIGAGYSGGGAGNLSVNSLFVDMANGDLRLRAGSPCVDTGTASGAPSTDTLGVIRPQGAGVDMGAYEVVPLEDIDGDGLPDADEAGQGLDENVADAALYATIDYPSNGASFIATPLTLSGRVSSAYIAGVVISTNGGTTYDKAAMPNADLTWSYSWSPSAGTYSILVKAANMFDGLATTGPITVSYDPDAPKAVITSPVAGAHIQGNVPVTGTAQSGSTGFSNFLLEYLPGSNPAGAGTWQPINSSTSQVGASLLGTWSVAALADGPYVLRLTVNDGASINTSVTHAVVQVDHDISAPLAPAALTISGGVLVGVVADGSTVNVAGTAEAGSIVANALVVDSISQVLIADVTNRITIHKNGSIRGTFTLPGGITASHIALRLSVKDAIGNTGPSLQSNALPVDNDGPTVQFTFPVHGAKLLFDPVVVTGTSSDVGPAGVALVEFSTNNSTFFAATGTTGWSYAWTPGLETTYTLYARATDVLGNPATTSIQVDISDTNPAAYITDPVADEAINAGANVAVMGTATDATDFKDYKLQYAPGETPESGYVNITESPIALPVINGTLAIWNTTGLDTGRYTLRLIDSDNSGNLTIFDRYVDMIASLSIGAIPDAALNENERIDNFVHLPDPAYTSAASGDPETFTYTLINVTQPNAGVTIDANKNIDINPTAFWFGVCEVTVQVQSGALTNTAMFTVTVNKINDLPTMPVVEITPGDPATTDLLLCTVTTPSTDADNDTVTYIFKWFSSTNGVTFSGPHRIASTTSLFDALSSSVTSSGEFWKCLVTPYDGTADGPSTSDTVRILTSSSISAVLDSNSITLGNPVTISGGIIGTLGSGTVVSFSSTTPTGTRDTNFPEALAIGGSSYNRVFYPYEASEGRLPWIIKASSWPGDAAYRGSESSSVFVTVLKAQPSLSLSLAVSSSTAGLPQVLASDVLATVVLSAALPSELQSLLGGQQVKVFLRKPDGSSLGPVLGVTTVVNGAGRVALTKQDFLSAGVTFTEPGTWQLRAEFTGNVNFKNASSAAYDQPDSARLTIKDSAGYAIVCVGKLDATAEGLDAHRKTGDFVYRSFRDRGFAQGDIYYLREGLVQPATDILVSNTSPSQASLQYAIGIWARNKMASAMAPLYVVLLDHGLQNQFFIYSGAFDETRIVDPVELDGYLTTLEGNLGLKATSTDPNITVVYGACNSGSFIPGVSKPGRVIIASAAANEKSHRGPLDPDGIRQGEVFVSEFFRNLREGKSIKEGFTLASDKLEEFTLSRSNGTDALAQRTQTPLLDDNGDGHGSPQDELGVTVDRDGGHTFDLSLGYGLNAGDSVGWIEATQTVTLDPLQLAGQLFARAPVPLPANTTAWLEVKTPAYAGSTLADGALADFQRLVDLPHFDYEPGISTLGSGIFRWQTFGTTFDAPGTYRVYYFVKDGVTQDVGAYLLTTVFRKQAGNQPPPTVSLLYPSDASTVGTSSFFVWSESLDPDGDPVTYTIQLTSETADTTFANFNPSNPARNDIEVEGLASAFTLLSEADGILDGATYRWRVIPVDQFGNQPASNPTATVHINQQNPGGNGSINGKIVDLDSGDAIEGASVQLIYNGQVELTYTTKANGDFVFVNRSEGNYQVTVTATNYVQRTVPVNLISGELHDMGRIEVEADTGVFRWGELNGDAYAGLLDGVNILDWLAGNINAFAIAPSVTKPLYPPGADVNANGGVDANDTTQILRLDVHQISQLPADLNGDGFGPDAKKKVGASPASQVTRTISLPDPITADPGEVITLPVTVDDAEGATDYTIELEYDVAVLTYDGYIKGALTNSWFVAENARTPGTVILIAAGTNPLASGGGTLVSCIFTVNANAGGLTSDLTLVRGQLGDLDGNSIPTTTQNSSLTVTGAKPTDINGDGKVNALDIQFVINAALGINIGAFSGDVNNDGNTNALDIQLVINAALGIA